MAASAGAHAEASSAPRRLAWLYSAPADLGILLVPCAVVLIAVLASTARTAAGAQAYTGWISQFVLGNSTHVILTFLLLGIRRDVLHATPKQATTVITGSVATFAISIAALGTLAAYAPRWTEFGTAIVLTFAVHHTLSQVKGIWSLYSLRGGKVGLPRPSVREAKLQRLFVPLGLLLIMIKWLFVPSRSGSTFPFLQAIPNEAAFLPYGVTYALIAAWCIYSVVLARELWRAEGRNPAKIVYVGIHAAVVVLMLFSPVWGGMVSAGIHGLEYFYLCGRMIAPAPGEKHTPRAARHPGWAIAIAVLPLLVIGLVNAPFSGFFVEHRPAFTMARLVLNGIVLAHYFADAWIYRFRIPEVRNVALARMHFA